MNGLSAAFYNPGNYFEIYSDGAPLDGFDGMKLVIDDGSHVLPATMVDKLVKYVENGGKLALICEGLRLHHFDGQRRGGGLVLGARWPRG